VNYLSTIYSAYPPSICSHLKAGYTQDRQHGGSSPKKPKKPKLRSSVREVIKTNGERRGGFCIIFYFEAGID